MSSQKAIVAEDLSSLSIDPSPYSQALIEVKRFAGILLHQQIWCFGKDIKNSKGNLLINYGFEQIRPPKKIDGCTNYIFNIGGEVSMVLWGFGIYYGYGVSKGVYIGRYNVYPKIIHHDPLRLPIWAPSNFPEMKFPEGEQEWEYSFRLMSELFEWIALYEEWVNCAMGGSYREACLEEWGQSIVSSDDTAWAWSKIANFLRKHIRCHEKFKPSIIPDIGVRKN